MRPETQRRVNAMLDTIHAMPELPDDGDDEAYIVAEDAIIQAYDAAEALFVFAHDCGEYELVSILGDLPFSGHPRLATGEDRGLTDEGLGLYRELLEMEGLDGNE